METRARRRLQLERIQREQEEIMAQQQVLDFTAAIQAFTLANPTVAAAAVPFALLPGAANRDVLDWNKSEAMKYFNKATSPLDTKFGFEESSSVRFSSRFERRHAFSVGMSY